MASQKRRAVTSLRLVGCLVIAASLFAAVEAQAENYTAEATACRTWTDLRASGRALAEMNWLEGYWRSAFDHHPVLQKHRADFARDKLYLAMDQYCAQYPDQSLRVAVHEIELSRI